MAHRMKVFSRAQTKNTVKYIIDSQPIKIRYFRHMFPRNSSLSQYFHIVSNYNNKK